MNIVKPNWSKYLYMRESFKDDRLNKILDKISSGEDITSREKQFLSKFDTLKDSDFQEYSHLSMESTFVKISDLLENKKKIICNLYDRDGKISDQIISIRKDFESDCCVLSLKHGDHKLWDKYLYNIKYNFSSDSYSLESQDEYFEEVPIKND